MKACAVKTMWHRLIAIGSPLKDKNFTLGPISKTNFLHNTCLLFPGFWTLGLHGIHTFPFFFVPFPKLWRCDLGHYKLPKPDPNAVYLLFFFPMLLNSHPPSTTSLLMWEGEGEEVGWEVQESEEWGGDQEEASRFKICVIAKIFFITSSQI